MSPATPDGSVVAHGRTPRPRALARRRFLIGLGAFGVLPILAACGATAPPTAPAASVAPSVASSAAPTAAVGVTPSSVASAAPSAAAGGMATVTRAATVASATPATAGTPAVTGALRLVPLAPSELGAPAVPAGTVSTAAGAVPYAPTVALYDAYGTDAAPGVFPAHDPPRHRDDAPPDEADEGAAAR